MPDDFFEFVCVDEIQLASDYERGQYLLRLYILEESKRLFLGSLLWRKLLEN